MSKEKQIQALLEKARTDITTMADALWVEGRKRDSCILHEKRQEITKALDLLDEPCQTCRWGLYNEDDNTWDTDCANIFPISNGTPFDNNMRYCCFCSKKIELEIKGNVIPCLDRKSPNPAESDEWRSQATEFYENGGCPICFSTDEAGCAEGCYLGQLQNDNERLKSQVQYWTNYLKESGIEIVDKSTQSQEPCSTCFIVKCSDCRSKEPAEKQESEFVEGLRFELAYREMAGKNNLFDKAVLEACDRLEAANKRIKGLIIQHQDDTRKAFNNYDMKLKLLEEQLAEADTKAMNTIRQIEGDIFVKITDPVHSLSVLAIDLKAKLDEAAKERKSSRKLKRLRESRDRRKGKKFSI